jgi:magnesium chelatase subunit I
VYEGEQEGALSVALLLMGKVMRNQFSQFFPDPEMIKRRKETNPYQSIVEWFGGNELELENDATQADYESGLGQIDGLKELVEKYHPNAKGDEKLLLMEFALHGLAEHSLIGKQIMETGLTFQDLLNSVFSSDSEDYGE